MFGSRASVATCVATLLGALVSTGCGESEPESTAQHQAEVLGCTLPGEQAVTDYDGKWGEVGYWCDAEAIEAYYPGARDLIAQRYPGLIIQARRSEWAEREAVIAKMVRVIIVSSHVALAQRGLREAWTPMEVSAFARAALATGFVESLFSQYKMIDGRLSLMRGDQGHSHGLLQIHDRWHGEAVFQKDVGWDLLHNLNYGINFYLDRWEAVKGSAADHPCVIGDGGGIDLHALSRSTYSVYNSGNLAKACRWTNSDDDWYANDERYEERYQDLSAEKVADLGWVTSYADALEGLDDIDFVGILDLTSMPLVTCGDGAVASGEACDDGNLVSGDGCDAECTIETGFTCGGEPSTCATACGDGVTSAAEACDDGNTVDGDGCNAGCGLEHGFSCSGMPSTCASSCGDGIIASDESCDDGNATLGDGCSSCSVDVGFSCSDAEPSVCVADPPPPGGGGDGGGDGAGGSDGEPGHDDDPESPSDDWDDPDDDGDDAWDGGNTTPYPPALGGEDESGASADAACSVGAVGSGDDAYAWALILGGGLWLRRRRRRALPKS